MIKQIKNIQLLMTLAFGVSIPILVPFGLTVVTQAQTQTPSSPERLPVKPVTKMIYGQTTYFEENGVFLEEVDDLKNHLQENFGIELPSDNDYEIRTTQEAAYNYVVPKSKSSRASVGALFISPDDSNKLMRIICQNNDRGSERPADPQLIQDILDPRNISLQCGENSFQNLMIN